MKPALYEALKKFEERLYTAFPGAMFRLIDPFEGHDVAVEVTLPIREVTWCERTKLVEIAASLEEEYDVYIGLLTKTAA